jgi:hypothetical protein
MGYCTHIRNVDARKIQYNYRILPDVSLWQKLEIRLIDEVEHILIEYLAWLPKKARSLYEHADAMAKKSEVVCFKIKSLYNFSLGNSYQQVAIGVIEANPSATAGTVQTVQILREIHNYLPHGPNWVRQTPIHGDGGAVMRMTDAKVARCQTDDPVESLSGTVPSPQDFHKRMHLLQVAPI